MTTLGGPTDDDGAPVLDVDLAFGHHLLALADDVEPDEVEALAVSWFEDAGWAGPNVLALTVEAVLTGPWQVDATVRRALRLPPECVQVFLLRCPILRSATGAAPELTRHDPLLAAFPDGVPYGIEDEALRFLVAAARRLTGALRVAGSGAVVTPDPEADVNLTLYSPVWLDPDALVAVLRPVLPSVELVMDLADFVPAEEPPPDVPGLERLDEGEREWLHAEADAYDEAALAQPPVQEGYGAVADLGVDGAVEVAVEGEEHLPVVLAALDWAEEGVIAYAVRWWPPDEEALALPDVPAAARQSRIRARERVEAAALALYQAVGGEVADDAGFLVEPESLAPDAPDPD